MKDRLRLNVLYDYYGILLTRKKQLYFEEYYFHNLSLTEISENYNVSRNAIHKQLKDVGKKLNDYEKKLKLYEKSKKIRELARDLDNEIREKLEELI